MAGWPPFGPYGPGAGWPPRGFAGPFDGPSAGWMWGDPTYPPKFYYDAVPSEPNAAIQEIRKLKEKGNTHFKERHYQDALFHYEYALRIATHHGFEVNAAELHSDIAAVCLSINHSRQAFKHATKCIELDPSIAKGYRNRAIANRMDGLIESAVSDFMEAYKRSRGVDDVLSAVTLAVDHKCTAHLKLKDSNFTSSECIKLVKKFNSQVKCLKFLLLRSEGVEGSGIMETIPCDLSSISCSFFLRTGDLDAATLQALLDHGVSVTPRDLDRVVKEFPHKRVQLVQMITERCKSFSQALDLESLCKQSLHLKKWKFASYFISCGARPNVDLVVKALGNWKTDLDEGLLCCFAEVCSDSDRTKLLLKAIQHSNFDAAEKVLKLGPIKCEQVDLGCLIKNYSLITSPALIQQLLEAGVSPNDTTLDSTTNLKPLDVCLGVKCASLDMKCQLALVIDCFVKHGADVNSACLPREQGTTIVHKVTGLAISTGNTEILQSVCSRFQFPEDGKLTDKQGRNPFHLAVKDTLHSEEVCTVLSKFHINPEAAYKSVQRAGKGQSAHEKCVLIMQEAAVKFKVPKKKRKRKAVKENKDEMETTEDDKGEVSTMDTTVQQPRKEDSGAEPSIDSTLKQCLETILRREDPYFVTEYKKQASQSETTQTKAPASKASHESDLEASQLSDKAENYLAASHQGDELRGRESDDEPESGSDSPEFDGLEWEVECPDKVIKFFKDKQIPSWLRERAIRKIQMLAHGDWRKKLCKRVSKKIELYEARVTKSVRILWEVAVQFSSRCTKATSSAEKVIHVYSEVIRVWDIVLNHDKLHDCIQHIETSRDRGQKASITIPLSVPEYPQAQTKQRLPQRYLLKSDSEEAEAVKRSLPFVPAGSTKKDEYNVVTFYTFSSALARSMLEGENARREFPFKEWPKEHDIINMPDNKESILLLGRSGTGKTTCCLYRLWNHFHTYWSMAVSGSPLLCHKVLALCQKKVEAESPETDEPSAELDQEESLCSSSAQPCQDELPTLDSHDLNHGTSEHKPPPQNVLEHLHQVFVTKNYVLCAQMKKKFYDMASANKDAEGHMKYEDLELPTTLSEISDLAYPLFLTSRQFFLLLDNSLGCGKTYFDRAVDGNLGVKIVSSDYDHEDPDTLLDLIEESESENEELDDADLEEYGVHPTALKQKLQECREITTSYFAEKIWPRICTDKLIDPLLVWMEIKSFIKGSGQALETKLGYLSAKEYEEIGKKMAPNFSGNRSEIYKLFEQYQLFCLRNRHLNLFDECDMIYNIYTRMNEITDLPWSVHEFYIDEVQDFTQAELSVLLRCCRDPNGLFLTGDTAQSIMRGISFRFGDLTSLFYDAQQKAEQLKSVIHVGVPQVHQLTINFRSHSGILQLAASVIDLLKKFFPSSFDCLPGDEGMFPGPQPSLLHSCSFSDLAILLRSNKREASPIEFGARQVIIVQSEDAKKALPDVLKAGNVLTVFEAKGLEFDDVLLYNFFADSVISKEWRVVTSFIDSEDQQHTLVCNESHAFESKPRPLPFDERHHKSLNPELKYLYTAITRAKCNLWIYDEDESKRLPIFDYWHKRGLVKIIKVDEVSAEDESVLFAATSLPEEWKKQGDYFKNKRLWEPAMKCYHKAKADHLEMEAKAYLSAHQAHQIRDHKATMHQAYTESALAFLQCDQLQHDAKYLVCAAKCLKNAGRHSDAANLFARLGQHEQALRGFSKSKDWDGCAKLKERIGDYNGVIQLLLKRNEHIKALEKAASYEAQGKVLRKDSSVAVLAYTLARQYLKDLKRLQKVLAYMPDGTQRIWFLKEAGLVNEACELHIEQGQYDEAYRILRAHAKYQRGIELANLNKDQKMKAKLVLEKAVSELVHHGNVGESNLLELQVLYNSKDTEVKAKAALLLGKSKHDAAYCKVALSAFKSERNVVGEVEAFNALVGLQDRPFPQMIFMALDACRAAKQITASVDNRRSPTATQHHTLEQIEDFYSLQKQENVYYIPPDQDVWVKLCSDSSIETDPDGMLCLSVSATLLKIRNHVDWCVTKWLREDIKANQVLTAKLDSFPFHQQMIQYSGHLKESFLTYPAGRLKEYLHWCIHALEVARFASVKPDVEAILVHFFSPQATVHLRVSKLHISTIRYSSASQCLDKVAAEMIGKSKFNFNELLSVWRIHCILGRGSSKLQSICEEQGRQVNILAGKSGRSKKVAKLSSEQTKRPERELTKAEQSHMSKSQKEYKAPFHFIYSQDGYVHIFSLWLKSCTLIREGGKVTTSSKIVLHYCLQKVADRRSLHPTLSVINLVEILCIHSTGLLFILSQCCFQLKQYSTILVPYTYEHISQVFDDFNCNRESDKWLLQACFGEVQKSAKVNRLPDLRKDVLDLLWQILDILVGKYNERFNVLNFSAMRTECLQSGEAVHCLTLVLTLFGNLAFTGCSDDTLTEYQKVIYTALGPLSRHPEMQHLQKAKNVLFGASNISGVFFAAYHLLSTVGREACFMEFKNQSLKLPDLKRPFLTPITLQQYPQRPMVSLSTLQPIPSQASSISVSEEATNQPPLPLAVDTQMITVPSGASVMDLTKIDTTLHGLQHSQEAIIQTQSIPAPVHDKPTTPQYHRNISFTDDTEEMEKQNDIIDDEEVQQALATKHNIDEQVASKKTPRLEIDQSMVDEKYCRICAVPLRPADPEKEVEEDLEATALENEFVIVGIPNDENAETLESHLQSDQHCRNALCYGKFTEELDRQYEPYQKELSTVLDRCQGLNLPEVQRVLHRGRTELQKNDKRIEDIKRSGKWREGCYEIETEMVGKMKSLISEAQKALQNSLKEKEEKQQPETELVEEIEEPQYDNPEEIDQAAPANMDEQKRKARNKKRKNKWKRV